MKKLSYVVFLTLFIGLMHGCSSTKKANAEAQRNRQFMGLKELVATNSFVFEAKTAYPMQSTAVMRVNNVLLRNTGNSAGRIDISGNGDFIEILNDSVQGQLPYFGEVRVVNSLDPNDSGINFNGTPTSYELIENEKKKNLRLEFDIKSKVEGYTVIMELYPSKRSTVFINCINRSPIRFDGIIKETESSPD